MAFDICSASDMRCGARGIDIISNPQSGYIDDFEGIDIDFPKGKYRQIKTPEAGLNPLRVFYWYYRLSRNFFTSFRFFSTMDFACFACASQV